MNIRKEWRVSREVRDKEEDRDVSTMPWKSVMNMKLQVRIRHDSDEESKDKGFIPSSVKTTGLPCELPIEPLSNFRS